jgi:hypothetical protein
VHFIPFPNCCLTYASWFGNILFFCSEIPIRYKFYEFLKPHSISGMRLVLIMNYSFSLDLDFLIVLVFLSKRLNLLYE